jgi:hypothetical protein
MKKIVFLLITLLMGSIGFGISVGVLFMEWLGYMRDDIVQYLRHNKVSG